MTFWDAGEPLTLPPPVDLEPRPVNEDALCECRHPAWMHNGQCHFDAWLGGVRDKGRCKCQGFVKP